MRTVFSKKLFFAASMLPIVVRGDLPGPTYIHRLRRIGIDVLSDHGEGGNFFRYGGGLSESGEYGLWTYLIILISFMLAVVFIVLIRRSAPEVKSGKQIFKNAMKMFKRKAKLLISVILGVGLFTILCRYGENTLDQVKYLMPRGLIYVDGPGWYYPDEVPPLQKKKIEAKITDELLSELQEEVDLVMAGCLDKVHRIHRHYGRGNVVMKGDVVIEALAKRKALKNRCKGIPAEWLAQRLEFYGAEHYYSYQVEASSTTKSFSKIVTDESSKKTYKTEADIQPKENRRKKSVVPSSKRGHDDVRHGFDGESRSRLIREEIDRHMKEIREFHENRKPGERFDHERMRRIHEDHHRRMREIHEGRRFSDK